MDVNEDRTVAPDDPISWKAVKAGTEVYGSDGERAGTLREVEGDDGADIFHGLIVATDEREVLVPADAVTSITPDRVDVAMTAASVSSLDEWSDAGASARPAGERETPGDTGPPAI